MRHYHFFLLLFLTMVTSSHSEAQNEETNAEKIRVFIDCSNTWCDMTFIKTEINLVDFLLDRIAADVHVLITSQTMGNGGNQYQLIFYGQNNYRNNIDTLRLNTDPSGTEADVRNQLIQYIKLGLTPFIARTNYAKNITIGMKSGSETGKNKATTTTKDPWNYWVFRCGVNGNVNADKVYKSNRFSVDLSANRTTEELKLGFNLFASKNKSSFEYESESGTSAYEVKNTNYAFIHTLVKSWGPHWSYGYEASYANNSFSNYKRRIYFSPAIEYNIFPYKEVNNKLFTLRYGLDITNNLYYETTLYEKTTETLTGHNLSANLSFNQKWGNINSGIFYRNYFTDWKLNNLGINLFVNIRITGGLSVNCYTFGGLIHDQIYLPKGGATEQEILTRRKQVASSYNFFTSFGLNYRFGSKLNNFVNPRFEGGGL